MLFEFLHSQSYPTISITKVVTMKISITSFFVHAQDQALDFYTNKLGSVVKNDVPLGKHRWLTVVSTEQPDGIPAASFQVDDLDTEYKRLNDLGVTFTLKPMNAGPVRMAVLDDTCGNLIQLMEMKKSSQ